MTHEQTIFNSTVTSEKVVIFIAYDMAITSLTEVFRSGHDILKVQFSKIRFNSETVARGYILNILNGGYNLNHDY